MEIKVSKFIKKKINRSELKEVFFVKKSRIFLWRKLS